MCLSVVICMRVSSIIQNVFYLLFGEGFLIDIDNVMLVHHIVGIWIAHYLCKTRHECRLITIGEIGSGFFNLYTVSKYYGLYAESTYRLYFIGMTLSNLYCLHGIIRHDAKLHFKIPTLLLIVGRQAFVFI
jgi:hypothetical protein